VRVAAELITRAEPDAIFPWIDDLGRYPQWLDIVRRAEPAAADPGDAGPAWWVDLRGRLGPLSRSKRLRMVRVDRRPPTAVAFERRELDGRSHSPWLMGATIEAAAGGSRLHVELKYEGTLFAPLLERLLSEEIERSKDRLGELVRRPPAPEEGA
jgi:hypothetical protein